MSTPQPLFNFDDNSAEEDYLDFNRSARNLGNQLNNSQLPTVLGLFGKWGAGKSSYLKFLAQNMLDNHIGINYFEVNFEPWKLEKSSNIAYDLVSCIHLRAVENNVLTGETEPISKQLFMYLDDIGYNTYREMIVSSLSGVADSQLGIGKQVNELLSKFIPANTTKLAQSRINAASRLPDTFSRYISTMKSIPIVFIDDLDRCKPETILSLFESLKLFFQPKETKIIYVLAMDHEMVIKAICERYNFDNWWEGWQYLSKICNQTFYIPRPQIKGLLKKLSQELMIEGDNLDLFWEFLLSESTERLFYRCDLYLPRRLKRIVRHTHMALSSNALGIIVTIKKVIAENKRSLPNNWELPEKTCYKMLLGLFMLREAYPEVYSRAAYKVHERRADLLLDIGKIAENWSDLDNRKNEANKIATKWGLSELHPYISDHVLLDLMAILFNHDDLLADYPPDNKEHYEQVLRTQILNPILDVLMST